MVSVCVSGGDFGVGVGVGDLGGIGVGSFDSVGGRVGGGFWEY